jgi:hypothetical protein
VSLGRAPIGNATYWGTTGRCSCGAKFRSNETPTGKGRTTVKAAHTRHVDEVAGKIEKVGTVWHWTPPGPTPGAGTSSYRTKRDALAARDAL